MGSRTPAINRRATIACPSGTKEKPVFKCPNFKALRAVSITGAKHVPSRKDGRSHCQSQRDLSSKTETRPLQKRQVLLLKSSGLLRSVQSSRWDGLFSS